MKRRAQTLVLIGLLVGTGGAVVVALAEAAKDKTTMDKSNEAGGVLDLVPKLIAARPFRAEDIGKLTGVTLQQDRAASNPHFTIYKGQRPAGFFGEVELRAPTVRKMGKDGLLILTLAKEASSCINQKTVLARFGQTPELAPPSPHAPPDALIYLRYPQPWGVLSFGFSRTDKECLGAIVLDAIAK